MMKTRYAPLLLAWIPVGLGQSFIDLNFELANPGTPTGQASLPGWSVQVGSQNPALIGVDTVAETSAFGTLLINSPASSTFGYFSVYLQAGFTNALGLGNVVSTTLSQVAIVPPGAQTLRFYAHAGPPLSDFHVSLGGQTLSLIPVSPPGGAYDFAAPISTFDGQKETLAFTVDPGARGPGSDWVVLDNISFSPMALPVPEPAAWSLAALGVLGLATAASRQAGRR